MDLDYVRHHVSRSEMPRVPDERRRVRPVILRGCRGTLLESTRFSSGTATPL